MKKKNLPTLGVTMVPITDIMMIILIIQNHQPHLQWVECHNEEIPLRKYSIKTPSIYYVVGQGGRGLAK